jgi:prolyl 4-hydroxylase
MYCAVSCGACKTDRDDDDAVVADDIHCPNEHESCDDWASAGECDTNPKYMQQYCKKSCGLCHGEGSVDVLSRTRNKELQKTTSFGVRQVIEGDLAEEVALRVMETIAYMESEIVLQLDEEIRIQCQNRNELCAFWAVHGECELNMDYMYMDCAPSCMVCHLLYDPEPDCPKRDDTIMNPSLYPGDLNQMFHRIVEEAPGNRTDGWREDHRILQGTPNYTVHIHSQPDTGAQEVVDTSTPPWVITLDHFLTDEECTTMIQLGYKYEYERSIEKVEGTYDDVQSDYRTSENAWCSSARGCRHETIPARLHQRMADVLGLPPENSEDIQILKYEVGQY